MKLLICGTRNTKLSYDYFCKNMILFQRQHKIDEVIEGCCPKSADEYAERWATEKGIPIKHYPANAGNYLKRNIEMVARADIVLAFWNMFSHGTGHTLAHAAIKGIPVKVVKI